MAGLDQLTSFAFLPDGRILVVEQVTGRVRLIVAGGATADTTLTLPDHDGGGGEAGLLGIAVDPAWPARPHVYLYFNHATDGHCWIVRYTASGDLSNGASGNLALGDRYVVLADIPDDSPAHNGGALRFGPDGMLYAGLGEDEDPCAAQDRTLLKGVLLRLRVDALPAGAGGPPAKSLITPPGNPFPGAGDNAGLVWAFGLRNPYRIHVDPVSGLVYAGDVGQATWEEVDEAAGGENFGWPAWEGPAYRGGSCLAVSPATLPIGSYNRVGFGAAVVGAGRYRRVCGGAWSFPADYEGDYFFADYYRGFVRRLDRGMSGWAPAPAAPGQPAPADWATSMTYVSDWLTGPDGALYYCRQFPSGELRRIVYAGLQPPAPVTGLSAQPLSDSRIALAWTLPAGPIDAVDLERRIPPAPYTLVASLAGTASSHVDSGLAPVTAYEYRVTPRNGAGGWGCGPTVVDTTLDRSGVGEAAPARPFLEVYPNPLPAGGARLTIRLGAPAEAGDQLQLFDVAGRLVRRLDPGAGGAAAVVTWDGRDGLGRPASPGVYFVRFRSGGRVETRRIVLAAG